MTTSHSAAGTGPAAPGPGPRVRRPRRLLALLGVVLLVLGALATALAWLGSAQGLSWLLHRPWVEARSGLQVQGVRGSLWRDLRVRRLDWSDGSARLSARQLRVRWRIGELLSLQPRLHVERLEAQDLDWRAGSAAPASDAGAAPRLPATLRPPLPVDIDQFRVGRLRMGAGGSGAWRDLGSLQGQLRGDAHAWRLTLRGSGSWGTLQTTARIASSKPYALHGEAGGELQLSAQTLKLQGSLGGSLEHVLLQARAQALQARARVHAELRPFAPVWLGPARIDVEDLDPRHVRAGWPQARLSLQAELRQAPDGALRGQVLLRNAQPGPVDAQRLPLRELRSALQLRDGVLLADPLRVDLNGGATLDGRVQWPLHGLAQARLGVHGLDLHALLARLASTRLDGSLTLRADDAEQELQAELAQPGWNAELRLRRQGSRVDLRQASLQAHGASLRLSGSLDSAKQQAFRVDAVLRDFQPQRFGKWPQARLNLQLQAQGALAARQARFDLRVQPSQWHGRSFAGQARGSVAPGSVRELQADLRLGDNTLRASGSFGEPDQQLRLDLKAPALAQLGEGWGGSLRAAATLRGGVSQPSGELSLHAHALRGPAGVRVARLDADASLQRGLRGRVMLRLRAQDLQAGGVLLRQAGARVDGTLAANQLQLSLSDARHLRLTLRAHGAWTSGRGWSGSLDTLDNAGPYAVHLTQPAELRVGVDGDLLLRDARLRSAGARLDLRSLRREGGIWSSDGSARDIDPAYWARLAGVDAHELQSTLRLSADWQVRSGPRPQARLQVTRSSGDVGLPGSPGVTLGLSRLLLQVDAVDGRLHGLVDADGTHLGRLHANASVPLTHGAKGWGVAGDAALQGSARLSLPDISWMSALLPQAARVAGSLQGDLQVGGVAAAPRLSGSLDGSKLAVVLPELGLDLRDGSVAASFVGDHVELRSLRMLDRGGGRLSASGGFALAGARPVGSVRVQLDKLQALDRPGEQVRLSGQATLRSSARQLGIDADLHVDHAAIELAGGNGPQLADDVVVQGRAAPARQTASAPVHAVVRLDLGDDFHVSGHGVDARLGGKLLLRADPGQALRAEGSVVVRSGTYGAYGQSLQLVSGGSVNFSGPVNNPGLDLSAQREGLPVQVGVRISGTLLAPVVTLSSTPAMPDSAILSWLVLGQDPSTVGADQSSLLQLAGAALLSRGQAGSATGRLADALGLDELKVSGGAGGGLQNSVVTVGKKLSSRLSVSVERGLADAGSLFNVRYAFSKRLSLRLQSGTDNAVDVFYTFSFD